PIITCHAH
ncbi:hypothetical protein CISIN_1g0306291mg, partial [Citrus sinensis]